MATQCLPFPPIVVLVADVYRAWVTGELAMAMPGEMLRVSTRQLTRRRRGVSPMRDRKGAPVRERDCPPQMTKSVLSPSVPWVRAGINTRRTAHNMQTNNYKDNYYQQTQC